MTVADEAVRQYDLMIAEHAKRSLAPGAEGNAHRHASYLLCRARRAEKTDPEMLGGTR